MEFFALLYQITNIKNNRKYIGMTHSIHKQKSIYDRFELHMKGLGGVYFKEDFEKGFLKSDFIVELIESSIDVEYIRKREMEEISSRNTLYPMGYNGNMGLFIIMTPLLIEKIKDTKRRNKAFGLHVYTKGTHTYKHKDNFDDIKRLKIDDPLVISGEYVSIRANKNTTPLPVRIEKRRRIKEEKIANGGRTNKGLEADNFLRSDKFKNIITSNPNWIAGRQKNRERLNSKQFTPAELDNIKKIPERIKQHWATVSDEDKADRIKPGLDSMNSHISCKYCGFTTNKGNIKRYHDEKCKYKMVDKHED